MSSATFVLAFRVDTSRAVAALEKVLAALTRGEIDPATLEPAQLVEEFTGLLDIELVQDVDDDDELDIDTSDPPTYEVN